MTQVTTKRVGGHEHGSHDLLAEERRVAGNEAVVAGRVDRSISKDAQQHRTEEPADSMRGPHVESIVPLHTVAKLDGQVADRAGAQADRERRPRRHEPGARGHTGKSGDRSREGTIMLGFPALNHEIASQVHIATDAAMSVLTNACAAMPLAASAEPPLKPNQPNHNNPVPRPTKATLCGASSRPVRTSWIRPPTPTPGPRTLRSCARPFHRRSPRRPTS